MSLTRSELIQKANSTINTIKEFCNSSKDIAISLSDMKSTFVNMKGDIENNIFAEEIIANSTTAIDSITQNADELIESVDNVIKQAVNECNTYINVLESEYNATRLKDEEVVVLPRLEYDMSIKDMGISQTPTPSYSRRNLETEIRLTSKSDIAKELSSRLKEGIIKHQNEEVLSVNRNKEPDSSYIPPKKEEPAKGNNQIGGGQYFTTKEELYTYLDNVLRDNLLGNFDSNFVPRWHNHINMLLSNEHLDGYLKNIIVKNKVVICVTNDNQIIQFNDVSSLFGLIGMIKDYFNIPN